MKKLRSIWVECILMLVFTVVSVQYWTVESHIGEADGKGYYDYLPSAFIHHDLIRKDWPQQDRKPFERIDSFYGIYVDAGGKTLNKYAVGTALLQAPFFGAAYMITERTHSSLDGYQTEFQTAIFIAALFYLFLSLILLNKILEGYGVGKKWIVTTQFFFLFSTTLTHYTNAEASFSHVYSLVVMLVFIYLVRSYFKRPSAKSLILTFATLGFIMLLRQVNPIVVLFVPFLAGTWENLKEGFLFAFRNWSKLLLGLGAFVAVSGIQTVFWYFQTGSWLVYSYQGESFDFLHPEFFKILFSYKKGLFVYTPILLLGALGTFTYLFKDRYAFFSWWFGFLGITYVLSSWWSWYYGCSFGNRAYIEFYPFFFIPFAMLLNTLKMWNIVLIPIALLTAPINMIQTYQYHNYILHWIDMDKVKFWSVFMQTDPVYNGLNWKEYIQLEDYSIVRHYKLGDHDRNENYGLTIDPFEIPNREKPVIVSARFRNRFDAKDRSKIILCVNGENKEQFLYWREIPLIHFNQSKMNKEQIGRFDVEIPVLDTKDSLSFQFYVTKEGKSSPLRNITVEVYQ